MAPKSKKPEKLKLGSTSSSGVSPKSSKKEHKRNQPQVFRYKELGELTDQFATLVGEGKYAKVYKGKFNYKDIAVKVYNEAKKAYWENEKEALISLDSPHIVSIIGIQYDNGENFSLVMNYVPNNLEVVLQGMELAWPEMHKILLHLAMAIQEISHKGFVVGDIKPDNILLDKEYNVCLCDFGSARKGGKDIPTVNRYYTARELIIHGSGTSASDTYSFGVILLQMIMKKNEFGAVPTKSLVGRAERSNKKKGGSNSKKNEDEDHISVTARYRQSGIVHKSTINSGCSEENAVTLMKLGIECTDFFENRRPSINDVVSKLRGLK